MDHYSVRVMSVLPSNSGHSSVQAGMSKSARSKTEGGNYSLSEVLLEKKRRTPTNFGVRETAAKIVELSAASSDGLITYGDLWNASRPHTPWQGNKTQKLVSNALARVIHYCVVNRLPIITVRVVNAQNRKLSSKAIQNIYEECKDLGVDVGLDPRGFVDRQFELSRALVADQLPSDT
jgi:hypothetical protein